MSFFKNEKSWPLVPLKDIATLKRGYDLPTQERKEGVIPIYAANGQNGQHNEAKIKGPGVITGRSGTIGKVHYTKNDFWPLNTALYVMNFHGNDPKWVFYLLQAFKLERFVEGAGVPTLNRNLVHGELIPLPRSKSRSALPRFWIRPTPSARSASKPSPSPMTFCAAYSSICLATPSPTQRAGKFNPSRRWQKFKVVFKLPRKEKACLLLAHIYE